MKAAYVLIAPKNTKLLLAVLSKLLPLIITVVRIGPYVGENDVIVGTCATRI